MVLFRSFFDTLSRSTGVAPDHFRVVFALLLMYPTAVLYKHVLIRSPIFKHWFNVAFSFVVLSELLDLASGFYALLLDSLVAYTIMYAVRNKWGPRLVFLVTMGHLLINHVYRLYHVNSDRFDTTGPQMVLVIKLTSLAFNVYDGQRPLQELSTYQQQKRVKMPTLPEFLGYVYFFGGILVGPAFEFADYRAFTTLELFTASEDSNGAQKGEDVNGVNGVQNGRMNGGTLQKRQLHVPSGFRAAMAKLGFAVFWAVVLLLGGDHYPVAWTLTDAYAEKSFLYKLYYINVSAACARFKYYVVWLSAEGACILVGLGFNGVDERGRPKWNRVANVDVIEYEKADNIKSLLESWNMNTNKWLKNYVYLRVTPPGKKPSFFSTLAAFGTSAIWHGFYPGYYLTFVSGAFVQYIHRTLRRTIRPIFLTKRYAALKPAYDFAGWLVTQSVVNYLAASFVLLSFEASIHVWASVYFVWHAVGVILLLSTFILRYVVKVRVPREIKQVVVPETGIVYSKVD